MGRHWKWRVLVTALIAAQSCTTFDPPERSAGELSIPDTYTLYGPTVDAPDRWWETWSSEELDRLIGEALSNNFSLQQAVARIRQAGALAKQAEAARWPEVSYSADASVTRTHTDTGSRDRSAAVSAASQKLNALNTLLSGGSSAMSSATGSESTSTGLAGTVQAGLQNAQSNLQSAKSKVDALQTLTSKAESTESTTTTESYGLGLTTSYELDLWGRLRAAEKSANLDLAATREDFYNVVQTVAAQVALTWLDILQDEQILDVLHEQLKANQTNLELVELRYRKGLATALDVFQQRQAVAQVETTVPPYEARLQSLHHQLAVLIGMPPRTDLALATTTYPEIGDLPDRGLPADLLANRPDVRAAGLRLRSADWAVSAARADRLPSIRLSASAIYTANEWDLLFDNWMATLAASVTGPIFDAGLRKAEVQRTRYVVDENLAAYKEAVVIAVQEVEDALVYEARQRDFIEALARQLGAAQNSYNEALNRYRKGLNDYLPVLSALTNVQSLELSLVQARHDLLTYRVELHLALGGAWMRETPLLAEG
jgi:NodT family efflux transporter outer membrane factor (OMF) lipoprotein